MARQVECVPNFSEGRRREVVEELVRAVAAVPGVTFLDSEMDADHNRSVLTFAEHPRMGAADVVPFVPVAGVTLDDCVRLARLLGKRVGEELGIPVYLYEAAATRPERVSLAEVRRGEFEGLRELIGRDPARRPDFGPGAIHPSAGAIAIGARRFLVAFNANLNTGDVRVARAIAAAIREQSGGLKHVRALGFSIEGGRRAQVSMNLVNTEATPIHRVLALVRAEAARWGAAVAGCEVVGLIPEAALLEAAEHALQLENFRRDQVLEQRLRRPPTTEAVSLGTFFDQVASPEPTPGGGTAAAVAGALAASLTAMVAGLTVGKKKYAAAEAAMNDTMREAAVLRRSLMSLARQDSEAYQAVVKVRQMSQATPDEAEVRTKALQAANLEASRVPLRTAEACLKVLELAAQAARLGNANAVTDAGTAGLLAAAAAAGALLNVEINLKSLPAGADKNDVETALQRARSALGPAAQRCTDAVHSALKA